MNEGDYVFIYETSSRSNKMVPVVEDGKERIVHLLTGKKGIIALVKISGLFEFHEWTWDGIPFMGFFPIEEIQVDQSIVSLDELDKAWRRKVSKHFTPHINGGIRQLEKEETKVLRGLMKPKVD